MWYPDRKIRLFDRRIAKWGGLNPHDKIELQKGIKPVHLPGDLLHYSFTTPEDLAWQNNRMTSISAASLYASGKRSNYFKMLAHPTWAFINGYFLRMGFLDGLDGFTVAVHGAHRVFMKYTKLWRLQKANPKKVIAIGKSANSDKPAAKEG